MKVIIYTYNWNMDIDGEVKEGSTIYFSTEDQEQQLREQESVVLLGEGKVFPTWYTNEERKLYKLEGLTAARRKMVEEFTRQLESIDNQIEQLKAITYDPTPAAE